MNHPHFSRRLVGSCVTSERFFLLPVVALSRDPVYQHESRYEIGRRSMWTLAGGWGYWHVQLKSYL